jgi:hypothetical protein
MKNIQKAFNKEDTAYMISKDLGRIKKFKSQNEHAS